MTRASAALTDAELLAAHVAGDREAFGELFRRHKDRMWAVAVRTCGDPELAADCVQEAFIAAFRRASSYRGEAAVTTWLHRIVVNACLDRLRRVRPTSELPSQDVGDDRDEHSATETRLDVRAALDRLPPAQRAALVLVDMHGMPVAEAAQILEVAEGTVKSRCFRGRAALAELLGMTGSRTEPVEPVAQSARRMTDTSAPDAVGSTDPPTVRTSHHEGLS